ncbi:hypothetical protein FIV42_20175 [Persicimonas caeni]|uniref:CxxC-x17-CxxC domain-containing protein n=1 Tax=Persicimonas caeni TaxID=2292766 RepID=A0A4Y6PY98_PERCE|nr:CxxC-x17-CxxC domain-containing protein [Persicimonas caeni]QDG52977.1 hypothetical protein FIV42_20175 [Persicimonas caeni]QED34199.1 hypothetical protein FRD00_20170 [Persicimonas caeni]
MTDKERQSNDDRSSGDKKSFRIVCTLCGCKAEVPFKPRRGQDVFCPDCFKFKRDEVNQKRQRHSPRKKHGTRVMFPITCAQCGKKETLDYVPKGVALHEVMCSECVRTTYGEQSRWAQIKETKAAEQKQEWEFTCEECGREDYLKFPPKPDRDYLCVRCFNEQEAPSRERLQGKQRVGRAVYIRTKDEDSE